MRSRWFGLVVAALGAVVSVWAYGRLPETVATHWNLQGTPDGFSSRIWAVVHGLILANGLGYTVQVDRLLPVGVGLLFVFLGNYLTRVEPNWFIGVRTPWTLSSDTVWRKVHRTAGWLFVIAGIVIAAGAFAPRSAFMPLFVVTIVAAAGIPVAQSYVLWKREQHDRR